MTKKKQSGAMKGLRLCPSFRLTSWPVTVPQMMVRRPETPGLEMKDSLLLTEIAAFSHCFPEFQVPQDDTKRAR